MIPQPWSALNGKLRAWCCYKAGEQFEYAGTAALKPRHGLPVRPDGALTTG
jgi:hypothetical protein